MIDIDEVLLSTTEVARLLGVSRERVRQLGDVLRPVCIPGPSGKRNRKHYDPNIVRAYLKERARLAAARANAKANIGAIGASE